MHLCNRVDRRSKSQNISELAFSLNRYHNSATPLFYSETQSDISFLIILVKDNHIFLIGEFYKKNGLLNGDFYNHNLMEVVSLFLVMIYVHTMMTQ